MPPTLMHGDCLDLMDQIPGGAVNLICADLPYGSVKCDWDKRLPVDRMWAEFKRVLSPAGVVALNADFRFAVELYLGNPRWFRYDIVWRKTRAAGFLDAKHRPMRSHELLLVFSRIGRSTYRPQMRPGAPSSGGVAGDPSTIYDIKGTPGRRRRVAVDRYPISVIEFGNRPKAAKLHPTQKPDDLLDWTIRTYSNPGDLVLDPTMGSGTTGVSAIANGRRFIGIEADATHFATSQRRIGEARQTLFAAGA